MTRQSVEVVTVATQPEDPSGKGGHLGVLESSCRACGLELQVLASGEEWRGFGMKLIRVAEHVEGLPDDALVLFVDAYDVILLAGSARLEEGFLSFERPLVFSAELGCWPREDLAGEFPPPLPRRQVARLERRVRDLRPPPPLAFPFRYLNSGSYMGYAGAIRGAIHDLSPADGDDDQELFSLYFLDHQDSVVLDYESVLFQSLYGISPDDLYFDAGEPWVLHHRFTDSTPSVIHGNGWGMRTFHEILGRLRARRWPGHFPPVSAAEEGPPAAS